MIFGNSRPSDITWTVSHSGTGAGGSIVSSAANLNDNRPDTLAAMLWLSGSQDLTSTFHLRGDWGTAFVPRIVGLSNISLPAGTKVQVSFRRSADTLGTYPYAPGMYASSQRVFAGPRGEKTALLIVPPGASSVKGVDIQISNDVNGVASIAANLAWTLGEGIVCPADEFDIDGDWSLEPVDQTTQNFSWSRQPYNVPGTIYRQLAFKLFADDQKKYFGDPANPTVTDYEQLFAKLDRGQGGVYIPRYIDDTGTYSPQLLHRTAILGFATKLPKVSHKFGKYFDSTAVTVIESPIPT